MDHNGNEDLMKRACRCKASQSGLFGARLLFVRVLYVVVITNLLILVLGAIVEMGPLVDTQTLRQWSFPQQRPPLIRVLWVLRELAMYAGPAIFLVSLVSGDRGLIALGLFGAIASGLQYAAAIVPLV